MQKLKTEGGTVNDDSYVTTQYYDDLNAVDKVLHHKVISMIHQLEVRPLEMRRCLLNFNYCGKTPHR